MELIVQDSLTPRPPRTLRILKQRITARGFNSRLHLNKTPDFGFVRSSSPLRLSYMNDPPSTKPEEKELIVEMEKLEQAVRASVIPPLHQIIRGFFVGMASAVGALVVVAILIPILLYSLQHVQWVPLIGTFIERINQYTQRGG